MDWSLLFDAEPSARAKAEALRRALQERQGLGQMFQLSGDKVVAPVGQNLVTQAGQGMQQLGQLGYQRAVLGRQSAQDAATQAYHGEQLGIEKEKLGLARRQLGATLDLKKTEAETKRRADMSKAAEDLRKEFQGGQTYKNTQTIGESYKKIAGTSETGPGDVSLIYSYMRMVDPGSTVREGEFATAANAGGIPDRVVGWYNKAISGEKLPPEIRKQFKGEAKKLLQAQVDRYEETAKPYRRLAEQQGLPPGDVVLDLGLSPLLADEPAPASVPAGVRRFTRGPDGKLVEVK